LHNIQHTENLVTVRQADPLTSPMTNLTFNTWLVFRFFPDITGTPSLFSVMLLYAG